MKINKEEKARREGMSYALRIAKEKGIDGLEEELNFRNCTNIPIGYSRSACDEEIYRIKTRTCDTIMALWIHTIADELGFGSVRLQRLIDRFEERADCISGDYCTWKDVFNVLKEEKKLELKMRFFGEEA